VRRSQSLEHGGVLLPVRHDGFAVHPLKSVIISSYIYCRLPSLVFSFDLFDFEGVVELESVGLLAHVLSFSFELAYEQLRSDCFVPGLVLTWNDPISAPFRVYGSQVKILVLNIVIIFVNQLFGDLFVQIWVFL